MTILFWILLNIVSAMISPFCECGTKPTAYFAYNPDTLELTMAHAGCNAQFRDFKIIDGKFVPKDFWEVE